MKKNEKAFTMIELLAAIIIMGVLLGIAIPGVTKLMKQFRKDYYVKLEESITESAKEFYTDNKLYKPDGILKSSYTELNSLVKNKYTDSVVDYKGKSCSLTDSYVIVIYFGKDNYKYKTCLKCSGDNYSTDSKGTYCDEAWKTNDNIKYQFDNKDRIYVYYNAQREEIRKQLMSTLNIVKLDKAGTVLESVLAEENKTEILPVNIDELDTTPTLDSDNKKISILRYTKDNTTQSMEAVVYKYKAPKVTITKIADGKKYVSGSWSNGVQVKLETNYSENWNFYNLTNTKVANYQVYLDNKWENVECKMTSNNSCTFTVQENISDYYKFRIVTDKNQISDETITYNIRVDVDKPTVKISPNGDEPIIKVGSTQTGINFILTTNDTGGSRIKSRKFALSDSNKEYKDTDLTSFYTDTYTYSKLHKGCKKYVWVIVEDCAGNKSTEVYPSKEFWTKYEIVYDANGGINAPSTQYKYYNKNLTLTSSVPTKTGYKFAGWSSDKNATNATYKKGDTYKKDEATTLYAVWTPNKITLRYLINSGEKLNTNYSNIKTSGNYITYNGSINFAIYDYDEVMGENGLADYNNTGWINIEKIGNHAVSGAEWKNQNGKTFNQLIAYNANELCDATKGDCTANMRVNWEENKIYLYYSIIGGGTLKTNDSRIGTDGSYITLDGNRLFNTFNYSDYIGKDGLANYNNTGWINIVKEGYHAVSGAEWKDGDGKTFNQATNYQANKLCDASKKSCNAVMFVNWVANSYTIKFDANGGTVNPTSKSATYKSSIKLPNPTRNGYIFNGWYTAANGGGLVGKGNADYLVTYSATFYAHWTQEEHEHVWNARSYKQESRTVSDMEKYFKVNESGHWCTNEKTSESCFPTNYTTDVPMYRVTCSICGKEKETGKYWCPVHASGGNETSGNGGKSLQICDAKEKKYSKDATNCIGKSQGWTLVSK